MNERSRSAEVYNKYVMYFSFFMAFFYTVSGFIILLNNKFKIDYTYRILFCVMLVGYGIFRLYRAIQLYKKIKADDNE